MNSVSFPPLVAASTKGSLSDLPVRNAATPDIKNLISDFGTFSPTFILSVPRVFAKIDNSSEQKAVSEGRGRVFRAAATTAIAWSQAQETGGPGALLKVSRRFLRIG